MKVVANGRTVFEGRVQKDVRTLTKWADIDNDRTMLFGAEIHVDLDQDKGHEGNEGHKGQTGFSAR